MFREKPTLVRELRSIGVSMGVRVVSGRNGKSCKSNVRRGQKGWQNLSHPHDSEEGVA